MAAQATSSRSVMNRKDHRGRMATGPISISSQGSSGGGVASVAAIRGMELAPLNLQRAGDIAPEGLAGLRTPIQFSRSTLSTDKAAPALGDGVWRFRSSDG